MSHQVYRLPFGKHKHQTLQEIPPDYRLWLINQKVYIGKPDLTAALIAGNYLSPNLRPDPITPPSTPRREKRKRPATDEDDYALPPSSVRKLAISDTARRNGTMLNYDGSAYILDFGQHYGERLPDVPRSYVRWLIKEGAHGHRPDLAAALREEGMLPADSCPVDHRASVDATPPSSQESQEWRVPGVYETSDIRFYDPHRRAPRWISDADASRYFGLDEPLLSRLGIRLVSEQEIRGSTQYAELVSVSQCSKRWLYQVYACAGRDGGVVAGVGTADDALRDFLGKNRRREDEIRDALGFGD